MSSKRLKTVALAGCGIAAAAVMSAGGSAKAATLFSTGFEVANAGGATFTSTGYTQGAFLTGQGTQAPFTSAVTSDVTSGSGAAVVANYTQTTPFTGTTSNAQYVQLNDGGGITNTTFASYFPALGSISPVTLGTPIVDVTGAITINSGATGAAQFGLIAFDGTAAQNEIADLAINAATGRISVDNGAVSTGTTAATNLTQASYELQLNFLTQTYNVYTAPAGSTAFTTLIATAIPFETTATTFSTAGIDTFATATTGTGLALFDNLTIRTAAVPEPASASLVVAGLAVAGGRRRRRSSGR